MPPQPVKFTSENYNHSTSLSVINSHGNINYILLYDLDVPVAMRIQISLRDVSSSIYSTVLLAAAR